MSLSNHVWILGLASEVCVSSTVATFFQPLGCDKGNSNSHLLTELLGFFKSSLTLCKC